MFHQTDEFDYEIIVQYVFNLCSSKTAEFFEETSSPPSLARGARAEALGILFCQMAIS